ncbi:MAG TPA: PQQ-dependent sugar dehydrogenase [Pyrinomonadaceae bacterium]|jgi:glucose/arabinose dehydrogenase
MKKLGFWAGLFLTVLTVNLFGQGVPAPLTIRMQPFLTGLTLPVHVTSAKDGTNRLFVVQQRGIIKVVQPGSNAATDFLNVSTIVSSSGNERGLLGLAFHPQYSSNRRFFIYYTRQSDGAIEIAEYQTSAGNPNQANPTAVRTIITIPHASFSNHNGGTIAFGPDGYLYAGTGDGGSGNDPNANAQNINALLGKILRLDINAPVGQNPAYNIPPTNPYAGATPGADEVYAIGMRNPYRFSFDRGGTNQLWVGDVGQDAIEEVDTITLGGNYGWRVYEGTRCTNNDPGLCTPTNYLPPVFQYSSASPDPRCSVTGGYIYRGTQNTLPTGSYLHADYCTGEIFLWNNNQQTVILDTSRLISSFGEDEAGELYVVGLGTTTGTGTVEKVVRARASADFDGDFKTDLSVFRPAEGVWYINHSSNNTYRVQGFGLNGDIPTPEDYDGDNITDIGVFRPSNGTWYHFLSSNNTVGIIQFGASGDIPAQGDYDGDAKADFAVFRPTTGTWYRYQTSNAAIVVEQFGLDGDIPTSADWDGDGKTDVSVWRPSNGTWYRLNSTNRSFTSVVHFGANGDVPAPGDYDGDGLADFAVYRNGTWYIRQSSNPNAQITTWGLAGDIPVVGDYDGDGRDDIGVFRPSDGVWYVIRSSNSSFLFTKFGLNGDLPAPSYDAP